MASSPLDCGRVEIFEEDTLGIGSYGVVCRAKCGQLPCAAKLLHQVMFLYNDPGVRKFAENLLTEGQFLSSFKHPNVVQYLASVRDPKSGRPALLMELMEESLTEFLERGPPPYYTQLNVCHDVALALSYLHNNHIIHRDLSSNNVLLMGAGRRAKVTDFGMSRLMDMNPRMTPLTQCPGMAVCMPPEALTDSPHYSDKLDCFSWGVLTIQVMTGNFPNPTDARSFHEDSRYPTGRIIVLVPEVERRRKDINLIKADHPLLPVALQCLKDKDTARPSANELCETLAVLKEGERYRESIQEEKSQPSHTELEAKKREIKVCYELLDEKEQVVHEKKREIEACHRQLEKKQRLIYEKEQKITLLHSKLNEKKKIIKEQGIEIELNLRELKEKNRLIQDELNRSKSEMNIMNQELLSKVSTIQYYCRKYEELVASHKKERVERQKQIKSKHDHVRSTLSYHFMAATRLLEEERKLLDKTVEEEETCQAEEGHELEALSKNMTECPDYKLQKIEICTALEQCLKEGDTWYLVDVRWMKKWKKYVGYDEWDQKSAGQESAHPGPVDNSNLFKNDVEKDEDLVKNMVEEQDYSLLPELAWHVLITWYGINEMSRPIPRKVVQYSWPCMKKNLVEVYLLELKLCVHSNQKAVQVKQFSRADSVAYLKLMMRKTFSITVDAQCRLWHHNRQLDKSLQTLMEARIHSGECIVLEVIGK